MRTKLLKASLILALLAILLGMPLLLSGHRIRPESFARIRPGLTELEVEELLGARVGNYDGFRAVPRVYPVSGLVIPVEPKTQVTKVWASRHGAVSVTFDENGRVEEHQVWFSTPATWWAHQWERLFQRQQSDYQT